ncbi:MAG: hypothetical protein HOP31_10695 [Ignavibacteria bacterium]|nr:hypothetical protein [Ignavibacteria bacterium]
MIEHHDLSEKPGWLRMTMHPVMDNNEITYILNSIVELSVNHKMWEQDYNYDPHENNFVHKSNPEFEKRIVDSWFE